MKNKVKAVLLSVAAAAIFVVPSLLLAPIAEADPCTDTWSIVVGGLQIGTAGAGQDSVYLKGDQRVGYNTANPASGLRELNRLITKHRTECPSDHIKLLGHSEGAGIVHAWVTAHNGYGNINAILLSDPKRVAGPGGAGLSANPAAFLIGYPLAGVDNNFGDIPVLSACNFDDVICNSDAGWKGYLFGGAHARYTWNASAYDNSTSGVWFR